DARCLAGDHASDQPRQRDRRAHRPIAPQGRPRPRGTVDPDGARRRLHRAGAAVSIRARLTLWCAATIALVLLAFAFAANALLARRLAAALDVQLADDKEVAEQVLERDPGGGLVLKARGHGGDPPLAFSFAVQAGDGRVLLTVPSGPPPWTGAL